MDQGVIKALSTKYRSLAVHKLTLAFEEKEPMLTMSIQPSPLKQDLHQLFQNSWHLIDVQVDVFDIEDDESVEGESVTKPAVTEAKKSYLNSRKFQSFFEIL